MWVAKDSSGEICLFKDKPHYDMGNWHIREDCEDNINDRFSLERLGYWGTNNMGLFREEGACSPFEVVIVPKDSPKADVFSKYELEIIREALSSAEYEGVIGSDEQKLILDKLGLKDY